MNVSTFRLLIPMLNAPTPQQWPEDLRPPEGDDVRLPEPAVVEIGEGAARRLRELVETPEPPGVMATTAEEAAQALDVLSQQLDELPTFRAPQAKGPNRAQRRARR